VDALDLAEAQGSAHFQTIGQAIATCEEMMHLRMVSVNVETRELLEIMHADNNQEVLLSHFSDHTEMVLLP
jgi:hypothetical protein